MSCLLEITNFKKVSCKHAPVEAQEWSRRNEVRLLILVAPGGGEETRVGNGDVCVHVCMPVCVCTPTVGGVAIGFN